MARIEGVYSTTSELERHGYSVFPYGLDQIQSFSDYFPSKALVRWEAHDELHSDSKFQGQAKRLSDHQRTSSAYAIGGITQSDTHTVVSHPFAVTLAWDSLLRDFIEADLKKLLARMLSNMVETQRLEPGLWRRISWNC
jgi:predicted metal-dependent phosphoesterase TrpH